MTSAQTNQSLQLAQAALMAPVVSYFLDRGIPLENYLLEAGIDPGLLQDQTSIISRNLIFRFIDAVCQGEDIEDIGLLVGQATSLHMIGEYGQILLDAPTVKDYLTRGCRFINMASSGDYYWLADEGEELRFCATTTTPGNDDRVQNYLYILLITINTIRQATNESWCPIDIIIPEMTAKTAAKLEGLLPHTRVIREGKHASFLISRDTAKCRLPTTGHPPPKHVQSLGSDFKESIAQLLDTLIISGRSDITTAADASGMSVRTLQRKLKTCDSNYTEMVAQARIRLAKKWLSTDDRSMAEIAQALGYSDPANFTRAFRRVAGISPREFRRRVGKTFTS